MPTQTYGPPQGGYQREFAEPYPSGGNRPPDRRHRSKATDYTLKGLGLLGVAVVSGLAWWLVRNDPAPSPPPGQNQQTTSQYQFTQFHQPTTDTDCAGHATGRVREFLAQRSCQELTRSLYTSKTLNGAQVVVSVAEVRMSDDANAKDLNTLAEEDYTGNVRDLSAEGFRVPGGPSSLANGGYASKATGNAVIIVLSEYADSSKDTPSSLSQDPALRAVSKAALDQGIGIQ